MAQNPFEKALVDEGLVGTPLESLARSIYMQESSAGKNTQTSNAGAVGGMQILPGTFKEVLPGGNINDPYDNSRAGLRYIKQMYNQSGGDLNLTAAGYYGGPGGMQKAKQGVAVSDPRNPNAPTTLEYAKQVMARQDKKNVSRETLKPEKVIGELGQGYQAAYALMSMADEEPETTREIEAREAAEEQTAAQQFANMQKQLASIKPATPFAAQGSQEPQEFNEGGEAVADDDMEAESAKRDFQMFLQKATREESPLDVKFQTPPQPMVVEGMGLMPAAPASVQGRVGYNQDGFRMGASGVAIKTPEGVKVMPGMYDVGYKMPVAGGELDLNYTRGMKTMPGMKTPQMANVRYVRKFEDGGDVSPAYDKKVSPEKKLANMIGLGPAYEASVQAPKDMGMSGDEGTQGDAVRHMVLMREIEKKYGPTAAKALGYGHEFVIGALAGQSSRAREMDIRNNALGLDLSKEAGTDQDKFNSLVRQSLESKRADYYRDEYKKPRKRAEGSPEMGEVSGRTFEEGGPETAKKMLKDVARGVSYYPYDLVGAPVDIINMGLKGVDYVTGSKLATEKPVGGSAYLIDKSNKLGIADKPTGSAAEDLARLGSAFINPAAGARATGRVLEKAGKLGKDVLEDLSMATTGQGGSKMAQMVTSQAQPMFAVRPKGGVYLGAQSVDQPPLNAFDQQVVDLATITNKENPQDKAILDFFDKKVRKYVQTQRGTPDDPIFDAYLNKGLTPISERTNFNDLLQAARTGDPKAVAEARKLYDYNTNITNIIPEATAARLGKGRIPADDYALEAQMKLEELIRKQNPNEPTTWAHVALANKNKMSELSHTYNFPGVGEIIQESEAGKLSRLLNPSTLPPHLRQAATSGEMIAHSPGNWSTPTGQAAFVGDLSIPDIKSYLQTKTPQEIKNMGVADVAVKSRQWLSTLDLAEKNPEKFAKKLGSNYLLRGTDTVFPTTNNMKWVELKDREAIVLDGRIQKLCTRGGVGHAFVDAAEKGITKLFSLRDEKGLPYALMSIDKDANGAFTIVSQVRGRANTPPKQYFNQIDDFFDQYTAKINKPLRLSENDQFLPVNRRIAKPIMKKDIDENGVMYEREIMPGDPEYPDVDDLNYPVND
jgi:SLT domain-containing protein